MHAILHPFKNRLISLLGDQLASIHLYGSCVMEDFQPGWSDIDVLCFCKSPLLPHQADALLMLRQQLVEETGNPLFRSIEGAVIWIHAFSNTCSSPCVYWGTGGQRIRTDYSLDAFSRYSLLHFGKCIYGQDMKHLIPHADFEDLADGIRHHLITIRTYAKETNESLYSCGWMLDIARCLYTLRHETLISKTKAGIWALEQHLCPEPVQMERTLAIRQNPSEALKSPSVATWLKSLGPSVQMFADVLEKELKEIEK